MSVEKGYVGGYDEKRSERDLALRKARRPMNAAPLDGTFIRLHFRPFMECARPDVIGHWQAHEEMPAGGSWFDREGNYISPGPIEWSPEQGGIQ